MYIPVGSKFIKGKVEYQKNHKIVYALSTRLFTFNEAKILAKRDNQKEMTYTGRGFVKLVEDDWKLFYEEDIHKFSYPEIQTVYVFI